MNVKAIRAAVAEAVNGLTTTLGPTLEARGYVWAGDPPFAYPGEVDGTYHETMEGNAGLVVTLRLLTSRAEDQSGQEMLDDFLTSTGSGSIVAALEADSTLGGLCDDLTVQGFTGYQAFEVAGTDYFGAEVTVVILA